MKATETGRLVRSRRTGDLFTVTTAGQERVILQSLDGAVQVLTGREAIELFYEEIPDRKSGTRSLERVPAQVRFEQ